MKDNNKKSKILYATKVSLKNEGQIKAYSGTPKWRELLITKPILKQILKGLFIIPDGSLEIEEGIKSKSRGKNIGKSRWTQNEQ